MALIGEDCHYYITVGCTRGNQCCFRHQPAARTTEVPCPEWVQGKCLNTNCGLRHVSVDRSRSRNVPCFYDSQPNGCLKPHCQFFHTKKGNSGTTTQSAAVVPTPTPIVPAPPVSAVTKPTGHVETAHPIIPSIKPTVPNSLIPPPPAPVHALPPAIGTPQIINGVLTIAPSRGILGAPPPLVPLQVRQQILPPLATQHVTIRPGLHVPIRPVIVQPTQTVQGHNLVPRSNGYPKSGHFDEQVRLFKEMLSAKQKLQPNTTSGKTYYDDGDGYNSDEDEKKRRDKPRKKNKREKNSKSKKRSKEDWSKADKEVLYGDYKNVSLDNRHKKNKVQKNTEENDSEIEVKCYEQVLREKALRKLNEKKKHRFNDDFEDILQASEASKKALRSKKYSSDGDETVDTKSRTSLRKSRKESLDLENEVFSKEDAVELGVEEDEFDIELENDKPKSKSRKRKDRPRKHSSEKQPEKETASIHPSDVVKENENEEKILEVDSTPKEEGVLVIPDETTDLTFSVDDTDDLALELTQDPETLKKQARKKTIITNKKVISIASSINRKNDKNDSKSVRHSKPTHQGSDHKSKNKRKILVVDSDSPVESKKNKDESNSKAKSNSKTETKKVINLARKEEKKQGEEKEESSKPTPNAVKIKTFEEIMEEKRKRKLGQGQDVVVLSDSDNSMESQGKKAKELLRERSEKFKSSVLVTKVPDVPPAPQPKTAAMLRREKLQLAKQEYEKRRQSQQLYQVKSAQGASVIPPVEETPKSIAVATTVKKVMLSKPAISDEQKSGVTVRSFEEIMQEKRLRKQEESQTQPKKVDSKPIQSFLRRRSLSNQRKNHPAEDSHPDAGKEASVPVATDVNVSAKPSFVNNIETTARQVPKETVPLVARIIGRRRSSSPSVVPQVENKTAPIKLKRKPSNSDCKLPSTSPLPEQSTSDRPTNIPSTSTVDSTLETKPIQHNDEAEVPESVVVAEKTVPESSTSIQEALDEKKRLREQEMLSDDEFEKEMNDLLSEGDDEDDSDDVNDDDFMMELQQMIDS